MGINIANWIGNHIQNLTLAQAYADWALILGLSFVLIRVATLAGKQFDWKGEVKFGNGKNKKTINLKEKITFWTWFWYGPLIMLSGPIFLAGYLFRNSKWKKNRDLKKKVKERADEFEKKQKENTAVKKELASRGYDVTTKDINKALKKKREKGDVVEDDEDDLDDNLLEAADESPSPSAPAPPASTAPSAPRSMPAPRAPNAPRAVSDHSDDPLARFRKGPPRAVSDHSDDPLARFRKR